jgi:hypothetical protein
LTLEPPAAAPGCSTAAAVAASLLGHKGDFLLCPKKGQFPHFTSFPRAASCDSPVIAVQGLHSNTGGAQQYRGCTTIQGVHSSTGGVYQYRGCTALQGVHSSTGGAQHYRGCTTIQGVHNNTGGAQQYRGYTAVQGLHNNTGGEGCYLGLSSHKHEACVERCVQVGPAEHIQQGPTPLIRLVGTLHHHHIQKALHHRGADRAKV